MHDDANAPVQARIQRRSSFVGTGCFIQALGLILGGIIAFTIPVIGWVIGLLLAVGLLINGSNKSVKLECSNCHNPIANVRVKLCPACGATFGR